MNGTVTMCSSATATECFAHTSSTAEATRRWGASGAISTSRRSDVRRHGRTRQRVILNPRRTKGGTGPTTTTPSPRRTRSGWISLPIRKEPPNEGAKKRRKRAEAATSSASDSRPFALRVFGEWLAVANWRNWGEAAGGAAVLGKY